MRRSRNASGKSRKQKSLQAGIYRIKRQITEALAQGFGFYGYSGSLGRSGCIWLRDGEACPEDILGQAWNSAESRGQKTGEQVCGM